MKIFYMITIGILVILSLLCLIRAIIGPKVADRIMAVNMIGTMTIAIICIYAYMTNETSLLDIAMIYAMMSFISVILLSKIYIGTYRHKKHKAEGGREHHV